MFRDSSATLSLSLALEKESNCKNNINPPPPPTPTTPLKKQTKNNKNKSLLFSLRVMFHCPEITTQFKSTHLQATFWTVREISSNSPSDDMRCQVKWDILEVQPTKGRGWTGMGTGREKRGPRRVIIHCLPYSLKFIQHYRNTTAQTYIIYALSSGATNHHK